MATAANSYYFRRRTIGRAASPPTWACYEQIHNEDDSDSDCSDSNSNSDSCSEEDEDFGDEGALRSPTSGRLDHSDDNNNEQHTIAVPRTESSEVQDIDMDMDVDGPDGQTKDSGAEKSKDVKGKQRAIEPEPEPESPRRQKKKRNSVYTLRPILTIQRSQGFVWNQDLFVPPYIKDRYVASTSPPNSRGFISTSVSSTNSAITDYEVEVVEIRVQEGELDSIIP